MMTIDALRENESHLPSISAALRLWSISTTRSTPLAHTYTHLFKLKTYVAIVIISGFPSDVSMHEQMQHPHFVAFQFKYLENEFYISFSLLHYNLFAITAS